MINDKGRKDPWQRGGTVARIANFTFYRRDQRVPWLHGCPPRVLAEAKSAWTPRTQHEQVPVGGTLGLLARDLGLGVEELELAAGATTVVQVYGRGAGLGLTTGTPRKRVPGTGQRSTAGSDRPERGCTDPDHRKRGTVVTMGVLGVSHSHSTPFPFGVAPPKRHGMATPY